MNFCPKCGKQIEESSKFCTNCGTSLNTAFQTFPNNQMQTQKKNNTALIIGIASIVVIAIIAICVIPFFSFITSKKTEIIHQPEIIGTPSEIPADTEQIATQDSPSDEVHNPDNIPASESIPDSSDSISTDYTLLNNKLNEIIQESSDIRNTSCSIKCARQSTFFENGEGVCGSLIDDVSGDGIPEIIIIKIIKQDNVTYTESNLYADIYTIENNSLKNAAPNILLKKNLPHDDGQTLVYLKNTSEGYNLICDSYSNYFHYADGIEHSICAYSCKNNTYINIANETVAGTDYDQVAEQRVINAARNAGLQGITYLPAGPLILQDQMVSAICGIYNNIDYSFDFSKIYSGKKGTYGTIYFDSLTDASQKADDKLKTLFITNIIKYNDSSSYNYSNYLESQNSYSESSEADSYILPYSSDRKLTKKDLKAIKNSKKKLRLARNEIYARHGRMFDDEELMTYFMAKNWYYPMISAKDFSEDILSKTEKANIKLIQKYENKLN